MPKPVTRARRARRTPIGALSREEKELVYAWRAMDVCNRRHMIVGTQVLCGNQMNERNISPVYRRRL